MLADDCV